MNKKIKIIELLNKIANGEKVPKIIEYNYDTFQYSSKWEQYIKEGYDEIPLLRIISDYNYSGLNDEVEILEDNTEEIEELNLEALNGMGGFTFTEIEEVAYNKINEIIKKLNQLTINLENTDK